MVKVVWIEVRVVGHGRGRRVVEGVVDVVVGCGRKGESRYEFLRPAWRGQSAVHGVEIGWCGMLMLPRERGGLLGK